MWQYTLLYFAVGPTARKLTQTSVWWRRRNQTRWMRAGNRDDREWTFTFPLSPIPMQSIPIFSFMSPSLRFIPIPVRFPMGYSHSHPIPKHAQQNNMGVQTVDSRATVLQKSAHQSLKNTNSENAIHNSLLWKSDKNISTVILQNVTSVMVEWHNRAQISAPRQAGSYLCTLGILCQKSDKIRGKFFHWNRGHSYSHLLAFSLPSWSLIPIPMGFPFPLTPILAIISGRQRYDGSDASSCCKYQNTTDLCAFRCRIILDTLWTFSAFIQGIWLHQCNASRDFLTICSEVPICLKNLVGEHWPRESRPYVVGWCIRE